MQKYLVLLAAVAMMACNSNKNSSEETDSADAKIDAGVEQVQEGLQQKADTAGAWFREQRDKTKASIEEKMKELDAKIEELKADGSKESEKARKKLENTRNDLAKALDDVKNSTAEAWDDTKTGIDKSLKKADDEWQEFKRDFKELFR